MERCVHGAKATLPECRKLERLEMSTVMSCDVVASHSLFAGLFNESGTKYPEFAALVPEISKVARAAVAA